jgi:alpha-ketoglutarate-dependent taurine dioxygenase
MGETMALDTLEHETAESPATIEVRPCSIHTGADIGGVDLTRPLAPEAAQEIRAALLKWKVIFFRDQHLDHRQHVDFARQFGEVTVGHAVYGSVEGHPEIYAVAKHRKKNRYSGQSLVRAWSGWHTDITAAINPPAGSILRGDVVPPYGGDTQFTNLVTAYEALSPKLREFLDRLRTIHRFAPPRGVEPTEEYKEIQRRRRMISEHPLIRVHPETGERVLFISPSFLESIVGLAPRESQQILEMLWEHAVRPEFTVRFRWEPGSIAFWDNRATAHLAPTDIYASDFERDFYRVTLVGDVPVGVDGTASKSIAGEPVLAV